MSDSEQRDVTLRINASEEVVLMDLLKFMYSNTLNIAAPPAPALVELLIADKFEVTSCVRYCSQLLQNLPMTLDSALLYLDLPHTILTTDAVQPLIDVAKQYLVCRYKDITKSKKEAMALPLSGIEAILASDDLQVGSEDVVYDFVLKWARQHYNSLYERMEVLGTRLARLIRFPYMTCQKLEKVLTCIDFRLASKLVREALFFKAEAQQSLGADASLNCGFVERAYKWRPVKVVEFELPREQCVVYMDLKRDEIATLFPFGRVKSQEFHLGGQMFFLFGECSRDNNNPSHHFAMGVGMRSKCLGSIVVDYEFAARSRPAKEEFLRQYKTHKTFTGGTRAGRNLFGVPWSEFMAEDYPFFINGVLHLKAVLTIRG
ncbi:BTB/POZ domain-containing protein At2g46260-like [Lotus japonicus]|uniref:BTB/POZ domain-containing protein At2g46260-like n=1 Tax=Lotus japonicus TaxID=34305 RepID=UPI00258953E7|nr:BTB/POZ domain-containing protein At2g46260-like [Lotus japonicus]